MLTALDDNIMKSARKCCHGGDYDDDVRFMTKVNKGAQKIMVAVPDQLSVVFMWSLLTGVFIVFLMTATCVVLRFESPPAPSAAALQTSRGERCPIAFKHPLVAWLDVSPGDVHYVFLDDDDRLPLMSACSLESAVVAAPVEDSGRVNVFVVRGINKRVANRHRMLSEVSLSSTLADLKDKYGDDRLNLSYVSLKECLECSPFQGMNLSGRPALAKFVVQLVVLWQFGGTVLDDGVVVVRGHVYRATGAAVEYGDRIISSPVACHAFVYNAMLSAKRYALSGEPFAPDTGRTIVSGTASGAEARPLADWIMCRDGVVDDGRCYYANAVADLHGYYCPATMEKPSLPTSQETIIQAEDDHNDEKRRNTTAEDERVSYDILI